VLICLLFVVSAVAAYKWWPETPEDQTLVHREAMKWFEQTARENRGDVIAKNSREEHLLRKCFRIGDDAANYEAVFSTASEVKQLADGQTEYIWGGEFTIKVVVGFVSDENGTRYVIIRKGVEIWAS
jgi:hypothetical protein